MGKIYKQLGIEERVLIQTQLAMEVKPAAPKWLISAPKPARSNPASSAACDQEPLCGSMSRAI